MSIPRYRPAPRLLEWRPRARDRRRRRGGQAVTIEAVMEGGRYPIAAGTLALPAPQPIPPRGDPPYPPQTSCTAKRLPEPFSTSGPTSGSSV